MVIPAISCDRFLLRCYIIRETGNGPASVARNPVFSGCACCFSCDRCPHPYSPVLLRVTGVAALLQGLRGCLWTPALQMHHHCLLRCVRRRG